MDDVLNQIKTRYPKEIDKGSIGLFEINRNEIVQYEIEDTECVFPNGISTIDYLNGDKRFGYDFQILGGDLSFYQQMGCREQTTELKMELYTK